MSKKIVESNVCNSMLGGLSTQPTAPVLECCDDSPYPAPKPPPYSSALQTNSNSEYRQPLLSRFSRGRNDGKAQQQQRPRRYDTDLLFKVALFTGIIAVFMLAGGIWCSSDTPAYCPYFSAIWTSSVFVLNAFIGIAAAKCRGVNFIVAYLVLSLVSVMLSAISASISARNWLLIGTYRHPKVDRNEAFCLIGEYDTPRMQYILTQTNQYDFKQCLLQAKIGISISSTQFIVAIIQGILNFLSSILCCKLLCTRCFGNGN